MVIFSRAFTYNSKLFLNSVIQIIRTFAYVLIVLLLSNVRTLNSYWIICITPFPHGK